MFFKLSFFKVQGNSLSNSIVEGSYVITKSTKNFEKNAFFIFTHKVYGKLIKKLVKIDSKKKCWFTGDSQQSISIDKIGPVDKNNIIGKVILCISKRGIKIFL